MFALDIFPTVTQYIPWSPLFSAMQPWELSFSLPVLGGAWTLMICKPFLATLLSSYGSPRLLFPRQDLGFG